MINKLKKKFVVVTTLSVAIMLFVVISIATAFSFIQLNNKINTVLDLIAENDGRLPKPDKKVKEPYLEAPREAFFDTRYFVTYFSENSVLYTDTGNIIAVDSQTAQNYGELVLDTDKSKGIIDGYKYEVFEEKSMIIFVDTSRDIQTATSFFINSSLISLFALMLVGILSYLFSPIAIKPIVEAYDKQKQFITNASHELKTPLTIISANLDILEMSYEENKWISSSKIQITRLTDLIGSLVTLTRIDEESTIDKKMFSLSDVVSNVVENYESLAKVENKSFTWNIEYEIFYNGNQQNIEQCLYIVLDNALKYSNQQGNIHLECYKKQDKIILIISNSVDMIEIGNHREVFERFYKADQSRNSAQNGFGIGLALAKSIVDKHKGKISAYSKQNDNFTIEIVL